MPTPIDTKIIMNLRNGLVTSAVLATMATATFAIVNSTYYFSDDFFLMFMASHFGSGWNEVSRPVYGHFVPGMLWIYWLVGSLGGLVRAADALVTAALYASVAGALYSLTIDPLNSDKTFHPSVKRWSATILASLSVVAALPILYLARGAGTLPLSLSTLAAAALLARGLRNQNSAASFLAALAVAAGFLFWELGVANIVAVPAITLCLLYFWEPKSLNNLLRYWKLRQCLAFGLPLVVASGLYARNYLEQGYGAGTARPSIIDWAQGVGQWMIEAIIPSLGGGPIPVTGEILGLSSGKILAPSTLIPILLGLGIVLAGMADRRLRPLLLTVLGIGLIQGAIIINARLTLDPTVFLNLRYVSDMLPYYLVLIALLWLTVLDRSWGRPRAGTGRIQRAAALGLPLLLLAATICGLISWRSFVGRYGGAEREAYIANSIQSVHNLTSGAQLLAGPTSPVIGWTPPPFDNTAAILEPALGASRWRIGGGKPLILDSSGQAVRAARLDVRTTSAQGCATAATVPDPLAGQLLLRTVNVRMWSAGRSSGDVYVGAEPYKFELLPGINSVTIQSYSGASITLNFAQAKVCLRKLEAFVAAPSP